MMVYQKIFAEYNNIYVKTEDNIFRKAIGSVNKIMSILIKKYDWKIWLNKIIEFQEEASVRQGELRYMEELYGPYARAEVFGVPYEESFHRGAGSLLWSEDGEALARAPLGPELHAKISGRLNQAEQALQLMRKRVPTDLSFYADYYKLASLKKIYNSQLLCLPVSK